MYPSASGALPLPANLTWHLFVSHSTSNQDWARTEIVDKLSSPPHHMRVAACYQSMPDSSRYDDKEIHTRMRESCVVLIALTPSYLKSGRLAVHIHVHACTCACRLACTCRLAYIHVHVKSGRLAVHEHVRVG